MSARTQRVRKETSKGKAYKDLMVTQKNKMSQRSKHKSDMEDLIKGMEATDLGRPADGARVEAAVVEQHAVPSGPLLRPPIYVANQPTDEAMDGLASAMGDAKIGGKKRRKTHRRRRHRRHRRSTRR